MKKIEKILVPTDFSEASSRSLSYAIWFADKMGASIDLLHVVYPGADVMDFPALASSVTQAEVESAQVVLKTFTDAALTRVESTSELEQVPVIKPRVEVGSPSGLIISAARDLEADLIIIGMHGEHSKLEIAFGSVTTMVMSRSEVPVLVVPAELHAIPIKSIGYATALAESDPYHIWESAQLLSPFNASLKVVHVRTDSDEEKGIDLGSMETFLADKNLKQVTFHEFADDDIDEGLEDFVSIHKVDLLIMHSPKRNLFERLGHRSITRRMALFCDIPLLILK